MRASDADRERTAERLRVAGGEGRLRPDELEQRVEAALSATTHEELDRLLADLPAPPRERRPPHGRASRSGERATFVATSVLLVAIWALTGAGYFWPIWPILGWGVFVLLPAHGPRYAAGFCSKRRAVTTGRDSGAGRS